MDGLVAGLLMQLKNAFTVAVCPGEYPWAVTVFGGVVALLPIAGAMLAALVRRFTGNRHGVGQIAGFTAIGVVFMAWLPWLLFDDVSTLFRLAVTGAPPSVFSNADLDALDTVYCFSATQGQYLGGAREVSDVIGSVTSGSAGTFAAGVALLGVVPLLCWVFVYAQTRLAFRRGPKWPARLVWVPMAALIFLTGSQSATVVAHLWLGFLTIAILGLIPVAAIGAPSWSVINNSGAKARAAAAPPPPQPSMQRPTQSAPPVTQQRPLPPPPMTQQPMPQPMAQRPAPTPTRVAPVARQSGPNPTRVQPQPTHGRRPNQPPPQYQPPPPLPSYEPPPGSPAPAPAQALSRDPGPLPETLQRALGVGGIAAAGVAAAGDTRRQSPPELPSSRFRRIRPLGTGGFGTVWLAQDTELDRTVAIKAAKAPDAETERRVRREARALAAVHHPNCVRVYDILADHDGELAIIMEYVPGRPLNAEIDAEGTLGDAQAARLWSTLAGALHAAHGKGVLHRDVKPANIIIDGAGYPHLIDFGIARASGDVTLTAAGMVLGTPDYMPPEVAAGKDASPAADAWQLAATVSYALAGQPPRGHRDGAIAAMLAAAQGQPCNQLPAKSAHLALLERSLDPDPARRPTLPAIQRDLASWLTAAGQRVEGPVTQMLPAQGQGGASPPAWPTEDRP